MSAAITTVAAAARKEATRANLDDVDNDMTDVDTVRNVCVVDQLNIVGDGTGSRDKSKSGGSQTAENGVGNGGDIRMSKDQQ